MKMKTVNLCSKKGLFTLHVETPLGLVNIVVGLHDRHGRRVENIALLPNHYSGEPKVVLRNGRRFVELKTVKIK